MNKQNLYEILEVFKLRFPVSSVVRQSGGCEEFSLQLLKFLNKNGEDLKNIKVGQLLEVKEKEELKILKNKKIKNYDFDISLIHQFIIYKNTIFDSLRNEDNFNKDSVYDMCRCFEPEFHSDAFTEPASYYKNLIDDTPENKDFENIKNEIEIYGFPFISVISSIEGNYDSLIYHDGYYYNENYENVPEKLTEKQIKYIKDNNIKEKLELVAEKHNYKGIEDIKILVENIVEKTNNEENENQNIYQNFDLT